MSLPVLCVLSVAALTAASAVHDRERLRLLPPTLGPLFPEIPLALSLFTAVRHRVRSDDPERGDAVQWVILVAVGVAMAVTVGTIIYNKVTAKANTITTDTPGAGNGNP
jgi:hypothetical protein